MTEQNIITANQIMLKINTLEKEIDTMSSIESDTRKKKECTHRLCLKKLFKKPTRKTVYGYWSSQDLDSINSIILFDADEVKVLIDFKQNKVEKLKLELEAL